MLMLFGGHDTQFKMHSQSVVLNLGVMTPLGLQIKYLPYD